MSKNERVLNFGTSVSLNQAATIIAANPNVRYFLRGEPGIGKSSILSMIKKLLPHYRMVYRDCGNLDLGDVCMPVIDHTAKVTRYYPNAGFELHHNDGVPVCIMLDEFTKAAAPVKNMLHPLLEITKPRLGDIEIPDGTIVIMTGNLATDGVGDNLQAHSQNRIVELTVDKPNDDQWINWAIDNGIEAPVIAWVKQFPHVLASYNDAAQGDNNYIFNPKKTQKAFVSPRSLAIASRIISTRSKVDSDSLIAQLCGAIGEAGARDLQAFIEYQDKLPSWESIIQDPKNAIVPTSAGACAVLVYGAVSRVDKETISPFMDYLSRFDTEWEAVFIINLMTNPSRQTIALNSKKVAEWVTANSSVL